jgi:hypothetical protein
MIPCEFQGEEDLPMIAWELKGKAYLQYVAPCEPQLRLNIGSTNT